MHAHSALFLFQADLFLIQSDQSASLGKKTADLEPRILGLEFSPAAHVQIKKKYVKVKPATSTHCLYNILEKIK